MSVLIKGMEMPKDCGECHFCHTENFHQWCCLTDETISVMDTKHFMCPLMQPVPCEDAVSRADLIERASIVISKGYKSDDGKHYVSAETLLDTFKDMPSAQSEIIRCKDCEYYYFADNRIPLHQTWVCSELGCDQDDPEFYCGYAERRTDEAD